MVRGQLSGMRRVDLKSLPQLTWRGRKSVLEYLNASGLEVEERRGVVGAQWDLAGRGPREEDRGEDRRRCAIRLHPPLVAC